MALSKITNSGIGAIDTLAVDTDTLVVDSTNNRIGVGTASPTSAIDVTGTITTSDGITYDGPSTMTIDQAVNAGAMVLRTGTNSYMRFDTNGSNERMRIAADGKLGIATTSPFSTLSASVGSNAPSTSGNMSSHGVTIHNTNFGRAIQMGVNESGAYNYIQSSYVNNANTGVNLSFFVGDSERLKIDTAGNLYAIGIYNNTTSGGGNVRVQSNGLLQRDTSSLRYKNTINNATHGLTELLTLRPVTYKSNTDGDTVFGGLIAEEVHDAGLTEFVSYNDDNEPDALAYGNMVSLCIKAIQEQQETITALEARIAALENA